MFRFCGAWRSSFGVLWLIFGFSPFAWDFPLGFVFFIFTVLFISGMVIMCVSDFVHFFGDRVFGWPFFGWACVFLLGFWKIHRFSPYEGGVPVGFKFRHSYFGLSLIYG